MTGGSAAPVDSTSGRVTGRFAERKEAHPLRQQNAARASDSELLGRLRDLTLHTPDPALEGTAAQT